MKFKLATAILLTSLLFLAIEYRIPATHSILKSFQTPEAVPEKIVVENVAFIATKEQNNWAITLKPGHFHKKNPSNSFAIIYNDIFYGVFLITDKIYVPVLTLPDVELIITSLDDEGSPLSTESYILGEAHESLSTSP